MNPKISIAVDSKNKAVATITGMATVGAKIDVEVTGLPSGIPDWGTDDKWNGESLRFRIVDIDGTDLVRFPLNEKTTSTDGDQWFVTGTGTTAAHVTYNGTAASPVDFDTDLLRKAFVGVPFNETQEFGIILDSIVDAAQYAVGKIKIRQWAVASTEDPTVLPDWRETLAELKEDLEAVEESKTAAAASATSASQSASSASTSASAAAGSALSALGYQNNAGTYATNAASSATSAGTSATNAAASEANALQYKNAAAQSATSAAESAEEAEETLDDAVHYTAQTKTDSEKAIARTNIGAVAAESGKGLSTNDYTTAEKNKLAGIATSATAVSVSASGSATDEVKYITVNGTEKRLAGGNNVSVSATGTATDEVQYITIDGVEKKLAGGGGDVAHSDFASVTAISDRFTLADVKGKVNEVLNILKGSASALALVLFCASAILPTYADISVHTAQLDALYNDSLVVTNVTGAATDPGVVSNIVEGYGYATTGAVDSALLAKADATNVVKLIGSSTIKKVSAWTEPLLRVQYDSHETSALGSYDIVREGTLQGGYAKVSYSRDHWDPEEIVNDNTTEGITVAYHGKIIYTKNVMVSDPYSETNTTTELTIPTVEGSTVVGTIALREDIADATNGLLRVETDPTATAKANAAIAAAGCVTKQYVDAATNAISGTIAAKRDLTNNVCAADSFTAWGAVLPAAPNDEEWESQPTFVADDSEWRWYYTSWYAESGNSDPNATSVTFSFTEGGEGGRGTVTFPAIRAKVAHSNDTFTTYGFVTNAVSAAVPSAYLVSASICTNSGARSEYIVITNSAGGTVTAPTTNLTLRVEALESAVGAANTLIENALGGN